MSASRGFRVTLGVIPDYASADEGLKIGGVRPDGPAEKAGIQSGDLIVGMNGKKILNIYDYMAILGELKAGDIVTIEILRGETRLNLEARGYEVLTANDGLKAVEIVANEAPDLIILDIRMPGLDGYEACQRIRQFSTAPIIMLTAMAEEADKVKGLDLGALLSGLNF